LDRTDRDFIDAGLCPPPLAGRATHLPLFDMQTVGCVAKGLFANESPDKYLMIAAPRRPE